jgi:hypothetical protein
MNRGLYFIVIIFALIIFISTIALIIYRKQSIIPSVKRPFLNSYVITNDGKELTTNIIFITHPFADMEQAAKYKEFEKRGNLFIGMTSYSEFPTKITNPHDRFSDSNDIAWKYNYLDLVDAWLYCFRNPQDYISGTRPSLLLSESDFADYNRHKPNPKIQYDFIYVCLKDNDKCEEGWQSYIRNWEVTKKMLDIMCNEYKLKGLLIGRIGCDIPTSCHHLMELTDFQKYSEFIANYNKCRFIFLPNTVDASPRVASEAMCYNLPLFMNEKILGGWKYVVPGVTGEFFNSDLESFKGSLDTFLTNLNSNVYKPREHFVDNYGPEKSGKKLLEFIKTVYPESSLSFKFKDVKYIKPGV